VLPAVEHIAYVSVRHFQIIFIYSYHYDNQNTEGVMLSSYAISSTLLLPSAHDCMGGPHPVQKFGPSSPISFDILLSKLYFKKRLNKFTVLKYQML